MQDVGCFGLFLGLSCIAFQPYTRGQPIIDLVPFYSMCVSFDVI